MLFQQVVCILLFYRCQTLILIITRTDLYGAIYIWPTRSRIDSCGVFTLLPLRQFNSATLPMPTEKRRTKQNVSILLDSTFRFLPSIIRLSLYPAKADRCPVTKYFLLSFRHFHCFLCAINHCIITWWNRKIVDTIGYRLYRSDGSRGSSPPEKCRTRREVWNFDCQQNWCH